MISSRKADALARAAGEISEANGDRAGEVDWRVANAGDPEQAEACVAATVERFGAIDILVNNAVTNPYYGPMIDLDSARADKTVRVNQTGYLEWVQAALLTRMSTAPNRSTVAATHAAACSGSPALATRQSTGPDRSPLAAPISTAARASASALREEIITDAPAEEKARAMACPMPLDAPVTSAVLPSRRSSMA
jgi:NAD(P)-dependent dehydrogenase (short-subunit alcohol dehydrogenase family)